MLGREFTLPPPLLGAHAALVIAHPGHELRVHGWLQLARPRVFVLTDGSGRSGRSRLSSTTKVLARVGAQPGSIYGRLTDLDVYSAMLNRDVDVFIRLVGELAETFARERFDYVAGDAAEGYNPTHDVCRLIIDAAVEMADSWKGHRVTNFDFSPTDQPDPDSKALASSSICLDLDEQALTLKLEAARAYLELATEVDASLSESGTRAFRAECLRRVYDRAGSYRLAEQPPFYERYGEKQVAAGHYQHVVRYHDHLVPIAEAVRRFVKKTG